MLQWLRKYSRSWFIALAIGAIVVVFIFWGVGGFRSPRFQEVAEVNGTPILLPAYLKQYHELVRQYQERAQGELTEETVKKLGFKEVALGRMVEEVLILQASEHLGIRVSKAELQDQIRRYPFFQEEGKFSERRYFLLLSQNRLSPADFEESERQRLLIQRVYREVTSFAKISDGELQELYRIGQEKVAVNYLVVTLEQFLSQVNPDEAGLSGYYQEHQAEFRQPERFKVNYLIFLGKDFLDRAKPSPQEVKNYLAEHGEEFSRPAVIKARQLLLTVGAKATAVDRRRVEAQAQDLLARVRAGEDFSQLAKANSQDERTRDQGGEMGYVKRGALPPQWEKVAFSLKPGEVGLASTPQGFCLILVEEVKEVEKIPEAETLATRALQEEKSWRLAQEAAQQAREDLSRASFPEVAKKYGLTPKESPLLGLQDPVPELGVQPKFTQAALKLKPGEISRVVELPAGFAILRGLEHQPEQQLPLAQVKEKVREAVKRQQAKKLAEQEAGRVLERLRKGEPLSRVAAQAGLTVKGSDFFTRAQGFLNQPLAESLTSAAFQLSSQRPYPGQPLFWKDQYYLLAFKARQAPDAAEFAKEKDKLRVMALEHKQEQIFAAWLGAERRRAKIKVYEIPVN
jgi:peptidyl-prolyl cis-trans isomerase D